jgi:hypothetical protein
VLSREFEPGLRLYVAVLSLSDGIYAVSLKKNGVHGLGKINVCGGLCLIFDKTDCLTRCP